LFINNKPQLAAITIFTGRNYRALPGSVTVVENTPSVEHTSCSLKPKPKLEPGLKKQQIKITAQSRKD
jgi:hypothetical protein